MRSTESVTPDERLSATADRKYIFVPRQCGNSALRCGWERCNFPGLHHHRCQPSLRKQGLRPLTITHTHAVKVYDLPLHHNDPFDRLIIAQALAEEMVILTSERAFKKYRVDLLWCGK
jgi:hypothetical protein